MVQHRSRTLQTFLEAIVTNAVLNQDQYFRNFLQDMLKWSENIMTVPVQSIPTIKGYIVKNFDERLVGIELVLSPMEKQILEAEKQQKLLQKHFRELAHVFDDVGEALNAFSLEYAPLADKLEQTGQTADTCASSLNDVILRHDEIVEELHELA